MTVTPQQEWFYQLELPPDQGMFIISVGKNKLLCLETNCIKPKSLIQTDCDKRRLTGSI